jgi:two-component system NtrC family sensor kinase
MQDPSWRRLSGIAWYIENKLIYIKLYKKMKHRLQTRQLLGYAVIVLVMGFFTIYTGFSFISEVIVEDTKLKVQMDLNSAWLAYNEEKALIQMAVGLASQNEIIRSIFFNNRIDSENLNTQIDFIKKRYNLDFLLLIDPDSKIKAGYSVLSLHEKKIWQDEIILQAISGNVSVGNNLIQYEDLESIDPELAQKAYIPLVQTELARPTEKNIENRGMVLEAAVPVLSQTNQVLGVIYGGILLNRKNIFVDKIRNTVFGQEYYKGKPLGTVTIFLWDVRIATNVIQMDSTRAIGTRVSEVVYHKVLEQGERFGKRAFVVNDWYLSAYDPIKDPSGKIIGMLYVGLLEKKYLDYKSSLAMKFLAISFFALFLAVGFAFYLSRGFRKPILNLVEATRELSNGKLDIQVDETKGCMENTELAHAFNTMARSLKSQTEKLQKTSDELNKAYQKLKKAYKEVDEKNKAYLEMLGFVTHELKSPLASIVFAIGALREEILGELNSTQKSTLKSAANSADYLNFTIANYLNLSRIEEGELKLKLRAVLINKEVVTPVINRISEMATDREMILSSAIPANLKLTCDPDLLNSVFQNLLSNAIKYGKNGGKINIGFYDERKKDFVQFNIYNEGPGFSKKEAKNLFKKFSRLQAQSYETKSGTGLGLFVTKVIIEKHGGKVWAESEPGQWANLIFTISTDLK